MLCGNLSLNNADNSPLTLAVSNISSDVLTPSFQQDIIVLLPPSSDRHHHQPQPGLPQLTEKRQTSQSYKNNRSLEYESTCHPFWTLYCLFELLVILIIKLGISMNAVICNKANGKLKSVPVHVDGCTLYKHKQTDYQIIL